MSLSKNFVDRVRAAADIVIVVSDHVPLRQMGATYKGACPFHADTSATFYVNREQAFFHCFDCHASGDVFAFVALREKVDRDGAVRHLARRFGITEPVS